MKKITVMLILTSTIISMTACRFANDLTMENMVDAQFTANDMNLNIDYNTEEYDRFNENGFKSVKLAPLSTFSADVDTASYTNIRRMINDGTEIQTDAVRTEEFINYFKYDYPDPIGNEPFSVTTELIDCPWNKETKLLSIGLKTKELDKNELKPSNLVFLLDVSGSMYSYDKLPLVQKAMKLLLENINEDTCISIVTYAGSDEVIIDGANSEENAKIEKAIDSLMADGSTNGSAGIKTAYDIAEKHFIKEGINRIILCTDGDLNIGETSEGDLTRLVQKKRKTGVSLTTLGFGDGNIKNNKMEALADNGNGNYYYIDTILEAKKVLVNEMGGTLNTVAKDVKFQTEFNPEFVKGYRLVGYENRIMNDDDFADDTKDAGEIGSGHTVTVLYEIVLNNSNQVIPEIDLKYEDGVYNMPIIKAPDENSELLTVNIRYKEPNGIKSMLITYPVRYGIYSDIISDNMIMASSAAEFAMLLKDSEFKGTSSAKEIIKNLDGKSFIENDLYKAEFLELVKKWCE